MYKLYSAIVLMVFLLTSCSITAGDYKEVKVPDIQLSPVGSITDRIPVFRWRCDGEDEYRIQIRDYAGSVLLTSDWKKVIPKNGECQILFEQNDHLRLWAGYWTIGQDHVWYLSRRSAQSWEGGADFIIEDVANLDFSPITDEWIEIGSGWDVFPDSVNNKSLTYSDQDTYLMSNSVISESDHKRLRYRRDLYSVFSFECGDQAQCETSFLLGGASPPGKPCMDGDVSKCPKDFPRTMLTFFSDGKAKLHHKNGKREWLYANLNIDNLYLDGQDNRLRISVIDRSPVTLRVHLNDKEVYCGKIKDLGSSSVMYGVQWRATGSAVSGEGLILKQLDIADGSVYTRCDIPQPSKYDW